MSDIAYATIEGGEFHESLSDDQLDYGNRRDLEIAVGAFSMVASLFGLLRGFPVVALVKTRHDEDEACTHFVAQLVATEEIAEEYRRLTMLVITGEAELFSSTVLNAENEWVERGHGVDLQP